METLASRTALAKAALRQAAPRIVRLQAQAGLALVTLRIQRDGLVGKVYSSHLVPTWWFANKALNSGGRAYIKKNRLGTWAGLRGAEGLPTDRVTLTHRGLMFRSLTPTEGVASGTVYTSQVVASNAESAQVLGYNQQRYGDFLQPLPSEAAQVAQVGKIELDKIVNQYLGNK